MRTYVVLLLMGLTVAACADDRKLPPAGTRISLSAADETTDERTPKTKTDIAIGQIQKNDSWAQSGFNAAHKMPHTALPDVLKLKWETNIGNGIDGDSLALAEPIVSDNIIYALDADFRLTALNLQTGDKVWNKKLKMDNRDISLKSIGLAFGADKIFAVAGDGAVYALDKSGNVVWKKSLGLALRSSPVFYDNTLYLMSACNRLFALNARDGSQKWAYQTTQNQTNLLGMGSPAIHDDKMVVGFSTGEVMAFNALTGTPLWTQNVLSARTYNKILDLAHVLASPVIDGQTAYIVGNSRKIIAFDMKSGREIFSNSLSGQNTPALSGNMMYLVADKNNLVALDKNTGKIAWETRLVDDQCLVWRGPILGGDNAVLVSADGLVQFVDLKTGTLKNSFRVDAFSTHPIVADGKLIVLTDDADILVYGE